MIDTKNVQEDTGYIRIFPMVKYILSTRPKELLEKLYHETDVDKIIQNTDINKLRELIKFNIDYLNASQNYPIELITSS